MSVCSWRCSVHRVVFLFLACPYVRRLKIIVNPDLYICTYIPISLVLWPFSFCLCRWALTAKSWKNNHLNRHLFQNIFLQIILIRSVSSGEGNMWTAVCALLRETLPRIKITKLPASPISCVFAQFASSLLPGNFIIHSQNTDDVVIN